MKFSAMELFQIPGTKSAGEVLNDTLDMAAYAEDLGFDGVWLAEHHFSIYGICGNPLLMAAAIAQRTTTLEIGTAVAVLPFYDPIRLAEDAALVDVLSNGRLQLGVGRGYQPSEFKKFRVDQATSRSRADEVIDILQLAWTEEEFSYDGEHFQLEDVSVLPKPVTAGGPPILRAAVSPSSFQAAGERGQRILTSPNFTPLETTKEQFGVYTDALSAAGHQPDDYDRPLMQQVYIGKDEQDAYDAPRPFAEWYHKLLATLVPGAAEKAPASYEQWDKISRNMKGIKYDDVYHQGANFRTASEAIAKIKQLRDEAGVNHYIGWFNIGGMDRDLVFQSMERFAKDVMPAFQE